MSISISNPVAAASFPAANAASNLAAAKTIPKTTSSAEDVVRLSESQQVYQLSNQGQGVPQIASTLGLTVDVVNSYLGITNTE